MAAALEIDRYLDYALLPFNPPPEMVELVNSRFVKERSSVPKGDLVLLADELAEDTSRATEAEVVLLSHLHKNEGQTDLWFDNLEDTYEEFWGFGTIVSCGRSKYAVIAEPHAFSAFKNHITNYIEESILPKLEEHLQKYFDRSQYLEDARIEGYGSMSPYNGDYSEIRMGKDMWLVFRLQ